MAKKSATGPSRPLDASARIVLFAGPEVFLRALYTGELREKLVSVHGEVDSFVFDGETAAAADVLDECRSFGLIARHKMVILDNASDLIKEDVRPLFENYAKSPSECTTLVLRGDSWRSGKLDALIEAVGVIKACDPLSPAKAVSWVIHRSTKRLSVEIESEAAELLVEKVGVDLARLDTELRKLEAAAGPGGRITAALVAEFVGASREEEAWKIQQTLLTGSPEAGLAHLRYLLDVSKEPSIKIAWAVTDLARKLHAASRARRSNQRPDAVASKLKLWADSRTAIFGAAERIEPCDALRLLEACVEAGVREKTGLGDIDRSLERLVIEFARVVPGPHRH